MEHLSKQQLILLALLVSFVTSLSTGIVTVSLMDQAPSGVTRTVSQVIERTIQAAVPQDSSVATAVQATDPTAAAVSKVAGSVVEIGSSHTDSASGLGLIVSKTGVIVTDRTAIAGLGDYVAVLPNGTRVPVSVVQMQANGDVVFLAPTIATASAEFVPIAFGEDPKLGQTALTLSGTTTPILGEGIVTDLAPAGSGPSSGDAGHIGTSIPASRTMLGSPLFSADGSVFGISTNSLAKNGDAAVFYPVAGLKAVIPSAR